MNVLVASVCTSVSFKSDETFTMFPVVLSILDIYSGSASIKILFIYGLLQIFFFQTF